MNNSFLNTKEGNSLIKLILWLVFIVLILVMFSNKDNTNNKENTNELVNETKDTFKSLTDMESSLLTQSMTYKYIITNNEDITIYNGLKCNNEDTWYVENKDGITKYIEINNTIYKSIINEKEQINEESKGLKDLFSLLKDYSYIEKVDNNERSITYNLSNLDVIFKTNLESITSINIYKDDVTYQMQFTNIGICDNINNEN